MKTKTKLKGEKQKTIKNTSATPSLEDANPTIRP